MYSCKVDHSQGFEAAALNKGMATKFRYVWETRHGRGFRPWVWNESGLVVLLTTLHIFLSPVPSSLLPSVSQVHGCGKTFPTNVSA